MGLLVVCGRCSTKRKRKVWVDAEDLDTELVQAFEGRWQFVPQAVVKTATITERARKACDDCGARLLGEGPGVPPKLRFLDAEPGIAFSSRRLRPLRPATALACMCGLLSWSLACLFGLGWR
jgi:hypothetical protein